MMQMAIRRSSLLMILLAATLRVPASAMAESIQVTSADPSSAPQGTVNLNVRIKGKGLKPGADVRFFVTGTTNPGGITVNATAFVSSTEVVANIDVDEAAVLGNFDIDVQAAGRTGKGIVLFAVLAQGTGNPSFSPLEVTLRTQAGGGSGDRIADDGRGTYVDGKDGVVAHSRAPGTSWSTRTRTPPRRTPIRGTSCCPSIRRTSWRSTRAAAECPVSGTDKLCSVSTRPVP